MRQSPSEVPERREPIPHPGDEIENPVSWEPSLAFLRYAIASMLAGALAFLIAIRIFEPQEHLRAYGSGLVVLVAVTGRYLLLRGRIQASINVLAYGAWVIATAISVFTGGVRAPIVITYPLIILMVGWMNSSRAALAVAGLTVATIFGFVLAESWGFLPTPLPTSPVLYGVVQVIVAILSVALIGRLVFSYRNRLKELNRIGRDLARRTSDLEAGKAELNRAQAVGKVGSWV